MADFDKKNQDLEQEYITLIDENGDEELYEILLTFESEDFDKNYVLVYPANSGEEELEIFAFSYEDDESGLEGELKNIETDEEWDMIEEVLGAFMEDEDEDE